MSTALVSRNIRYAISRFNPYVSQVDAFGCFYRYEFDHPDGVMAGDVQNNPGVFTTYGIFEAFDNHIDWSDPSQSQRGLRALSAFIRATYCDCPTDAEILERLHRELKVACVEDGFTWDSSTGHIVVNRGVALDEFDLSGVTTIEGILDLMKKINRATTRDKDNAEVIGFSKNLMEAMADAVPRERGWQEDEVRGLKYQDRCSAVMKELGITEQSAGKGAVALGIGFVRKGLNKVVEGIGEMRRDDTNEGHGMANLKFVSDADAEFALRSAVNWCHFILETHRESSMVCPF
ncbi:abortive infection family protein [Corynebacterium vitaeruminis]|nr:abortive infection family protein [Corynebacterium vitaeruminis]